MRLPLALFCLAVVGAPSQGSSAVVVRVGAILGRVGQQVDLPVSLLSGGALVGGAQVDLTLPAPGVAFVTGEAGKPDCLVNPGIDRDGASFVFEPVGCDPAADCTAIHASIVSAQPTPPPLADGVELFVCRLAVTATVAGVIPIGCSNAAASDQELAALDTTCTSGTILVPSSETPTPRPTRTPATPPREPITFRIGTATGNAIDLVELAVSLTTAGANVAGGQIDLQIPPELTVPATALGRPGCTVNPAIQKDGTSFAYQPSGCDPSVDCTSVRANVLALDNVIPIADGAELFRCRVQIATAELGVLPVECGGLGASDPDGLAIPAACSSGGVVIVSNTPSTPTLTATPTATPTPTVSDTPTDTPTPSPTETETPLPTATPSETATPTQTPIRCVGDCDGSGTVVIAELIRGVSIALGSAPLAECPAFDRTGGGEVNVAELINAVSNALTGCAAPGRPR